ncbi:PDZ domain-containing protein 2, partial [Nestor notabilis]
NKHVESVRPSILSDSPKSARSPFHRQRRVVFYDGDVSDDDEKMDDESQDSGSPRYSSTETSSPVFSNSMESADRTLEQIDSPFFPIIAFDYSSVPEVRLGSLSLKELREAQLESKRSPKLEHRAVTRVKSMMSTECRSLQRQRMEEHGSYNKPVARMLPHSKKCEAPEGAGQGQSEIVTLVRNEHESFGLDLEIQAMPLKVVVTGLRPAQSALYLCVGKLTAVVPVLCRLIYAATAIYASPQTVQITWCGNECLKQKSMALRTPSRAESPLRDEYTTMCCCGTDEGCPSSEPRATKEELLEKTVKCGANAQGILGLSVLDTINTGKLFTVNKNSLNNYSRNYSSLNEDELPAANTLEGKRSDPFPKNVSGLEKNLLEKEGYHDEQRSKSESEMVVDDCNHAVSYCLVKKEANSLSNLCKTDSNHVNASLSRAVSLRSPFPTKSKDPKANTTHELPGKNEKINSVTSGRTSNGKVQSSGTNHCKGAAVPHSPSSQKKSCQESKGMAQKSIMDTLLNNQKAKAGPKLKGFTIKGKAKSNSDSSGINPTKVSGMSGVDQKRTSGSPQLSPKLMGKKTPFGAGVGTGTGASSPQDSGSGSPGSASDDDMPHGSSPDGDRSENSWSIRLVSALLVLFRFHPYEPLLVTAALLHRVKHFILVWLGTMTAKEDAYFVVLHKEEGAGLGFSVAGGTDLEQKLVTVHRVFSKGVASQEGTIHRGDLVLSINGKSLENSVHGDVLNTLHQARLYRYAVIVIQKEKDKANNSSRLEISATGRKCVGSGKDVSMEIGTDPNLDMNDVICVELLKTSAGLGFSLDGGKASIAGDRPLLVKRIFKGGAAEQSGNIESGDEILAVSGKSLLGLMHYDAWNIIKSVPEGPVQLLIRK